MSQCSLDDSVEVFWDHDSPTPAVWKRLQGPIICDDNIPSSPKAPQFKTSRPPRRFVVNDCRSFEKSIKEADQIISALNKAIKENEAAQTPEPKLIVPEFPEEDESDEEKDVPKAPFKNDQNADTSLDVIFDMSGNGEGLAPTLKSTHPVLEAANETLNADEWADDDIFTEEVLSQVEDKLKMTTPTKPKVGNIDDLESTIPAEKTSTPFMKNTSVPRTEFVSPSARRNVKGFLDFMMDSGKPPKPSPKRGKVNLSLKIELNTSSGELPDCDVQSINVALHSGQKRPLSSTSYERIAKSDNSAQNQRDVMEDVKVTDTSIPLDVLNNLIDDSWTETEDEADMKSHSSRFENKASSSCSAKTIGVNKAGSSCSAKTVGVGASNVCKSTIRCSANVAVNNVKSQRFAPNQHSTCHRTSPTDSKKLPAARDQIHKSSATSSTTASAVASGCPYKFRKTENIATTLVKNKNVVSVVTAIQHNFSSDGFSSGDEDMLVEAAALTESQQSSKGEHEQSNEKTAPTSHQPKCTAAEIKRKKQLALNRRMQRMKQNFS